MESAKGRPLGLDSNTMGLVYYNDLEIGKKKLIPLESLNNNLLKKLIIERYRTLPDESLTSFLNGKSYTIDEIINEINQETSIGKSFENMEKNYLTYLLASFPKTVFQSPKQE